MSEKDPIATARDILEAELKAKKKEVVDEVEETKEDDEEVEEASTKTEGDCEGDDCDEVDEETDEETDEDEDEVEEAATAHAADGPKTAPKSAEGKGTEIKTDEGPDNSAKNKKSTDMKPSATGDVTKAKMKESIGSLFDDEDLSDEFKNKAETVFEAAVHMRIDEINTALVEEFETKLTETKEELSTTITERLNDYLAYVVEEWMKENEIAIERGVRDDIAEDFLSGLRNLFLENNIDIPEEKYDLVDEYAARIDTLEEQLNTQLESNVVLAKEVRSHKCVEIFNEVCDGLVDTDKEKLRDLTDGVEFESVDQYREKLVILRDNYFSGDVKTPESATFEEETEQAEYAELSNTMQAYATNLSRIQNRAKGSKEIPSFQTFAEEKTD
jgi:hypothetical protein